MEGAYRKDKNATKHSGHDDEEATAKHHKKYILLPGRKTGFPDQLQRNVSSTVLFVFLQVR